MINFVQKATVKEMIPKWESDVEDVAADNIIKVMFVKKTWKWTKNCWQVTGTQVKRQPARKKDTVKDERPRPLKKARIEAIEEAPKQASEEEPAEASDEEPAEASEEEPAEARSKVTTTVDGLTREEIEAMFKVILDSMREGFGTCIREIKDLSKRVEALEKKVGLTTKRKRKGTPTGTKAPGVSKQS